MKKKYPNWAKIYKTMLPIVAISKEARVTQCFSAPAALRELRTITIGGGRQNGKTYWAIGEVLADDSTIMVCKDAALRNHAVERYKDRYGHGGALKSRRKFFTANDLESMDQALLAKILKKTKRVIIDEARYNSKLTLIYNYLGQHADIDNIIIIQLGT